MFDQDELRGVTRIRGGYHELIRYDYEYKFGKVDIQSKNKIYEMRFDSLGNTLLHKGLSDVEYNFNSNHAISTVEGIAFAPCICTKQVANYNSNGMKISQVCYLSDGYACSKRIFVYNKKGLLTMYKEYDNRDNNPRVIHHYTFKYNRDNKLELTKEYILDSPNFYSWVYRYNTSGQVILDRYDYNSNGTIGELASSTKYMIKYDSFGNIIESIEYDKVGEPISKTEYLYTK